MSRTILAPGSEVPVIVTLSEPRIESGAGRHDRQSRLCGGSRSGHLWGRDGGPCRDLGRRVGRSGAVRVAAACPYSDEDERRGPD